MQCLPHLCGAHRADGTPYTRFPLAGAATVRSRMRMPTSLGRSYARMGSQCSSSLRTTSTTCANQWKCCCSGLATTL